ncbi:MAG: hypothetical protein K2O70_07185 [Desulfovibrionaceae bacterium]|nr:hypothetical protein [Desulfovibrionaceae bacterium]
MIEIQFDPRLIDQALVRLGGAQHNLARAVKAALMATAPQVRADVIGVLVRDITVGNKFVRRAVKAVRNMGNSAEFKVFSKSLFLDDYELEPREQTARLGMRSKEWPGFTYRLRRDGKLFHSYGTPTGSDGTGGTPFLARTSGGNLRVMYRRNPGHVRAGEHDVFLAYAPPIQYHAVAPQVGDVARNTTMRIFHQELTRAVDNILKGRAV